MRDSERVRARMGAAGVDLPPELVDIVVRTAGPLITSFDELVALAPDDVEPFSPVRLADET
jgi:hypothetical protein